MTCIAVFSAVTITKAQTTEVVSTTTTTTQTYTTDIENYVDTTRSNKANAYKTTWKKNRFKDTWFLSFGVGGQLLMGEDDDKGSLSNAITFAPSLTIGKYFSPIWGLRLNITGGSLHGYNDGLAGTYRKWNSGSKNYSPEHLTWDPTWVERGFASYVGDVTGEIGQNHRGEYYWKPGWDSFQAGAGSNDVLYMQHVRYVAANLDFMFDLLTLFGDYNPKRTFDISMFGGPSVFHTFEHKLGSIPYTSFGLNFGIQPKFRVSNKVNLFAEFNLNAYPDDFDGHAGDDVPTDLVAQAQVGLTLKLGKSTWEVCDPVGYDALRDLNDVINALRKQNEDLQNEADYLRNNPNCPPAPEVKVVEPEEPKYKQTVFLPDPVFFRIDKSVIDAGEWSKIEKAATYLNNNPGNRVVVTGYADKKTAYPAYNLKLSERRAKAVASALIERYNINPMRVSINWEGDQIQPFSINEWNRVVIFVIE